jgi:hypothetical protein
MLRTRAVRRRVPILLLLFLVLLGCDKKKDGGVRGSGVQTTKVRQVPAFSRLSVGSMLDVRVSIGKDEPMQLKGDDNLLEHVSSRLENGVLKLDVDTKVHTRMPLEVRLSTARLETLNASVAAKVDVQGLTGPSFEARAAGGSRVTVSGSTDSLKLAGKGAARFDFTKVTARSASVNLEYGSTARLGYLEKLDVKASGASRVYYQGEPEMTRDLHPPARLIRSDP